jgi:hypothetical protein
MCNWLILPEAKMKTREPCLGFYAFVELQTKTQVSETSGEEEV